MMKVLSLATLLVLGSVALAEEKKPAAPTTQPIAVNKFCAVEGEPNAIDPAVLYTYNGKTYGFCCEDCIAAFKKDPAKYAAKAK